MRINFNDQEKKVLSGFLFQTKYGARKRNADFEMAHSKGTLSESQFERAVEMNNTNLKRIEKLINKFVTPGLFVKLKRNDVRDLTEILSTVVTIHQNVTDADKPHLGAEDHETCKSAIAKLEDGMERSMSQDR